MSLNNKIKFDHYFLIYGIRINNSLYHDMIDFIVESGEWEGELMEFIGDDEWYFFEIEGRSKPERYEYLEGFLEENMGFHSIFNAKGENILYIGEIVWSTCDINVDSLNDNETNNTTINTITTKTINNEDETNVRENVDNLRMKLKNRNEYWADALPKINYYWIRGTSKVD